MKGIIAIEYGILVMVLLGGYIALTTIHINDVINMQDDIRNVLSARVSLLRVKAAGEFTDVSDGMVKMGVWVPPNTTIDLRRLEARVTTDLCSGGECIVTLDRVFTSGPTINTFTRIKISGGEVSGIP